LLGKIEKIYSYEKEKKNVPDLPWILQFECLFQLGEILKQLNEVGVLQKACDEHREEKGVKQCVVAHVEDLSGRDEFFRKRDPQNDFTDDILQVPDVGAHRIQKAYEPGESVDEN